jgi:putative spermidine/putrescine transport system ATP-binding protein
MSSIDIVQLGKTYGDVTALADITLHVEHGELLTILGPSGSGKTTILAIIAGLAHPTSGLVRIGNRDVTWLSAAKRNIGLVFQSYALFPHMNIYDNVAFPLAVRKLPAADIAERVAQVLGLLRLSGFEKRKPNELSGGQQQRAALARALVFRPDILLLDEPLGALDRKLREEVQVELRQLQRSLGITTILVTHDQQEALSLSDRIVVLADGRLQQVGAPEEVYLKPKNRFVADFLGTANFLDGILENRGGSLVIRLEGGGVIPCPPDAATHDGAVVAIVRPERVQLSPAGQDGPRQGGLTAEIVERVYLGQSFRYQLRTGAGRQVTAVVADRGVRFSRGETVAVSWLPQDVWIIAREDEPCAQLVA